MPYHHSDLALLLLLHTHQRVSKVLFVIPMLRSIIGTVAVAAVQLAVPEDRGRWVSGRCSRVTPTLNGNMGYNRT